VELYLHSLITPSWSGAQLKHSNKFALFMVCRVVNKIWYCSTVHSEYVDLCKPFPFIVTFFLFTALIFISVCFLLAHFSYFITKDRLIVGPSSSHVFVHSNNVQINWAKFN